MTDKTKELDIAQRIVEAISRTTEPKRSVDNKFKPEEDTVLGVVPEHLRHLHNLLVEVSDEAHAAERSFLEAKRRGKAVHSIFFAALGDHLSRDYDKCIGIKLCSDWQVVSVKLDDDDGDEDGLAELLAMAAWEGRHRC